MRSSAALLPLCAGMCSCLQTLGREATTCGAAQRVSRQAGQEQTGRHQLPRLRIKPAAVPVADSNSTAEAQQSTAPHQNAPTHLQHVVRKVLWVGRGEADAHLWIHCCHRIQKLCKAGGAFPPRLIHAEGSRQGRGKWEGVSQGGPAVQADVTPNAPAAAASWQAVGQARDMRAGTPAEAASVDALKGISCRRCRLLSCFHISTAATAAAAAAEIRVTVDVLPQQRHLFHPLL
jgi:hypothetical protein